jgi:hypothetical protein
MPFLLAIKAFDVRLVFVLSRLNSEGLILRFLIGFLADHPLVVVIADKFDDMGWVDGIAGLIGICSNRTQSHFVTGGKGCNENVGKLLIGDALAHCRELLTIISELCEMGTYIIILPTAHTLQLPPQVNRHTARPIFADVLQTVPPSLRIDSGLDPIEKFIWY